MAADSERIGSYQILFELGRGGMGAVYLARAVGPGGVERLVALKRAHERPPPGASSDRFLDEVRITAHVHHANVVSMHQAGADERGYYLVFDYVEGESLEGLIARAAQRGERVPARVLLRVAMDALAGLDAAHETTDAAGRHLGILHRDVSVQNLLVGRDGVTRLTDFGIAKSVLSSTVTEEGYVQGKLVYMAPEYVQRLPVDRTVDIYAMGVTLWTALSGLEPWHGDTPGQVVQSILMEGVPPLSSTGIAIAPELEAIVARACCRDAGLRFQTARQMLDELEAVGKRHDIIASHVEVAEYVAVMVGDELAARRQAINASRRNLEVMAGVAVAAPDDSGTDAIARTWEKPPPWRGVLYVGAVLAVLAIGLSVLSSRGSPDALKSAPSTPAARQSFSSPATPREPVRDAGDPRDSLPPASTTEQPVPTRAARPPPEPPKRKPRHNRLDQISTANPYQ